MAATTLWAPAVPNKPDLLPFRPSALVACAPSRHPSCFQSVIRVADNLSVQSDKLSLIRGFTLIELMVVLLIMSILMILSMPSILPTKAKLQIKEAMELADKLKPDIETFYTAKNRFPVDNTEAHLPLADNLIGNYSKSMTVRDGVIHIKLGNKIIPILEDQVLSIMPITVSNSPQSPISWICGYSGIPEGMQISGENLTDVKELYLPLLCRAN